MINATEARNLSELSGAYFEKVLNQIDELILYTANKGETSVKLYIDDYSGNGRLWTSKNAHSDIVETPFQIKIIEKLKSLRFKAKVIKDLKYIPEALKDCSGNGPEFTNHVIQVSW